jgi:hypothetical protein
MPNTHIKMMNKKPKRKISGKRRNETSDKSAGMKTPTSNRDFLKLGGSIEGAAVLSSKKGFQP